MIDAHELSYFAWLLLRLWNEQAIFHGHEECHFINRRSSNRVSVCTTSVREQQRSDKNSWKGWMDVREGSPVN